MLETVSALFLRADGRVLLGLRASWKRAWADHWDAIGGRVEQGEGKRCSKSTFPPEI